MKHFISGFSSLFYEGGKNVGTEKYQKDHSDCVCRNWLQYFAAVSAPISLGIPFFVILCALKNPWALGVLKNMRKHLVAMLGGTIPETSQEEDTKAAKTESAPLDTEAASKAMEDSVEDADTQTIISWYGRIGKERLDQIVTNLNAKGIYECWLRRDGICNIRTPKGYRRVGCLPEYPGEKAEDICRLLTREGGLQASVKGRYVYLSWNG